MRGDAHRKVFKAVDADDADRSAYPNLEGPGIGVQPFIGPGNAWVIADHAHAPPNTHANGPLLDG